MALNSATAVLRPSHVSSTAGRSDLGSSPHAADVLTIVIPALNEEESIGTTIQRCLDARERVRRIGLVDAVEVVVVSDGSTDRTAAIAQTFADRDPSVTLIVFEQNRGYGAAIKEGFSRSRGNLVAFLDADGTCDPQLFGDLCLALLQHGAAIALGSRMGPGTHMPRLRRLGNRIYALLLGSLSGVAVTDTASGMRVIRRDALAELYPLPDGLHFTPAMSARAIMRRLPIVEVPMPYAERVGESKLRVLRDGVRFFAAISDAVLLFHPGRIFGLGAVAFSLVAALWGLYPLEFYVMNRRLEEWMIYRLLLCGLLLTSAFGMLCATVLSNEIMSLVHMRRSSFVAHVLERVLSRRFSWAIAAIAVVVAVALVWPALSQYAAAGRVTVHWSRPVVAVFLAQIALVAVVHAVLRKVIDLWKTQLMHAAGTNARSTSVSIGGGRE
jgi:glycosyltransferase involved in cell wall biosynthesis